MPTKKANYKNDHSMVKPYKPRYRTVVPTRSVTTENVRSNIKTYESELVRVLVDQYSLSERNSARAAFEIAEQP